MRPSDPDSARTGHETRDVDVRGVAWAGAGLLLASVVVVLLMGWLFNRFAAREAGIQTPPASLVRPSGTLLPPEPRLQGQPLVDLAVMRSEEDAQLESYGWVDREGGVVRIPIDRAMELLLARGLPARAALPSGAEALEKP